MSDQEPTIDEGDIAAVETAVDGLLDKAQANLGFVYTNATPPPPPSVALDYYLYAGIEVYLTTQWTLFEGFTLTGITLKVAIDKYKASAGLVAHCWRCLVLIQNRRAVC